MVSRKKNALAWGMTTTATVLLGCVDSCPTAFALRSTGLPRLAPPRRRRWRPTADKDPRTWPITRPQTCAPARRINVVVPHAAGAQSLGGARDDDDGKGAFDTEGIVQNEDDFFTTSAAQQQQQRSPVGDREEPPTSFFDKYPLVVKSLSMGITYGLADVAAQLFARLVGGELVPLGDRLRRSASLILVGCVAVGPMLAFWFDFLEWLIPGRSARAVAARTALDQAVQVPICIAVIFTLSSLAEGHGLDYCWQKIQAKLLATWRDCVGVWTPVQFINQGLVPLKFRVLFQAIISFFWDTYLSIVSHSVKPPTVAVASVAPVCGAAVPLPPAF